MIYYRYLQRPDGIFGIEHRFECATDSTPWHAHENPDYAHACQLVRGRARIDFKKRKSIRITEQELLFDVTAVHRVTADRGDTVVFNRLYPVPEDWKEKLRTEGEWQCL